MSSGYWRVAYDHLLPTSICARGAFELFTLDGDTEDVVEDELTDLNEKLAVVSHHILSREDDFYFLEQCKYVTQHPGFRELAEPCEVDAPRTGCDPAGAQISGFF